MVYLYTDVNKDFLSVSLSLCRIKKLSIASSMFIVKEDSDGCQRVHVIVLKVRGHVFIG